MSLDIILQHVLRGDTDAGDLRNRLREQNISAQEYNKALFSILSCRFSGALSDLIAEAQIESGKSMQMEDMSPLKCILEEFYKVECCPSFLCHQAMLEKEDYSLVFQIYSRIFGLQSCDGEEMEMWIKESFEKYAKELVTKCSKCKTEKDVLDVLQKR
ncbi:uncharacterized protein VICG_02186 [Vittaforma corneae ATCC 50505]|uniref:Uncharacterized protein n=1 Tax=Vittaforma corneae (strain ATCC 50505) TaxID=993615 RepID=L2GKF6_VITCO|nr:uncharacterized protein VICG_02186 [Vittaforma corneae ATCC 50505]ELA40777.1 hypothetical protein VICG_02186 [Vittaforma corneae ATCC 50505]